MPETREGCWERSPPSTRHQSGPIVSLHRTTALIAPPAKKGADKGEAKREMVDTKWGEGVGHVSSIKALTHRSDGWRDGDCYPRASRARASWPLALATGEAIRVSERLGERGEDVVGAQLGDHARAAERVAHLPADGGKQQHELPRR
eukprot:CAMPEP_0183338096 /NCGR_PEP_ID=MMETSP0164_2-20130417/5512_1 /TAXON_ID=221442 /ORGANISM="Coccolithus pelagicus ssp braarudi, Strain PLY182g" /LENGTH=146 /DNA_ID=CAMNT_0025507891 /DNA_START=154 /DNA_END=592 /DNA_ORIENTATION=+